MEWLKQQGPWCPGLVEYLERHHQNYDVARVLHVSLRADRARDPRRAVEEPPRADGARRARHPARHLQGRLRERRRRSSGTPKSSARSSRSMFHLRAVVEDVVGCGVDLPEGEVMADDDEPRRCDTGMGREPLAPHIEGPANAFRRRHRMHGPFVLYGGRIDPGKGCEELLEYFQTYVKEGGDASLMLMGVKLMPLPDDPHVRFAGMLPDEERLHALEAATVVVVPSPHESLSLLALEAFAVGTPVLANARAEVLVEHCRQSNAGLYYADRWEFVEGLKLLMRDDPAARARWDRTARPTSTGTTAGARFCPSTSGCSHGCAVRDRYASRCLKRTGRSQGKGQRAEGRGEVGLTEGRGHRVGLTEGRGLSQGRGHRAEGRGRERAFACSPFLSFAY